MAQLCFQETLAIDHRRKVIEIDQSVSCGIVFDPFIHRENLFRWTVGASNDRLAVANGVVVYRHDGGKDDTDAVRMCELGHRREIVLNRLDAHRTGVAREVVSPGEYDDDFWLQLDHIGTKADQHLRRRLPTDTTVEVGLAGKIFSQFPTV